MEVKLHIADYIVMGAFLAISLGVGVYYGVIKKQRTTEEYLLGNRHMQLLPVALSMLVTYQSAISVIGIPAEFYLYNSMLCYVFLGIAAVILIQCFMIVPLMYPLHLTSAYEYLGLRFKSRSVQLIGTSLGMLQTLVYMSMVLLAPSLALEAVAGIPLWISVVLVGLIGTIYTSMGGIKSVIWTDVFQFVIMFGGLITILTLGSIKLGSYKNVWDICSAGDRIVFNIISGDPRIRHSVWSCLIGGAFNWLPNLCNQSAVQRICSMKTQRQSQLAVFLNTPLTLFYGAILFLMGTVMYAYFENEGCDPLSAGVVKNGNQVTPYFVMHILANLPGLAGLFLAALFSGALSSLSSGINAMGANTIQDILVNCLRNTTQQKKTFAAKLIVFVYGAVAVTLAYLAKDLTGPVTQISLSAMGAFGGPVAGMIFLGGLFPQANWIGAIFGSVTGIGINVWISVCSVIYGRKTPFSPSIGVAGCYINQTNLYNTSALVTDSIILLSTTVEQKRNIDRVLLPGHLPIYDVTYLYFGLIGFLITIIVGVAVSLCTGSDKIGHTDPNYIFPFMRRVWKHKRRESNNLAGNKSLKMSSGQKANSHPTDALTVDTRLTGNQPDP